jgi:TrmH family RNA methyltransferase
MKLQKYKHSSLVSYALGATLVAELLKTHPELIARVYLRPTEKHGDDLNEIISNLEKHHIEIIESTKAFNILGAKDNCLLAAEFKKLFSSERPNGNNIVLVNPSDTGNLGTIMRSAVAFGYKHITIVTPAVDPYDPKVVRASMGAIFHLDITITDKFEPTNNTNFAFILNENAIKLNELKPKDLSDNYTLIFGNEAAGLPKDFCEKTGATPVYIPQSPDVDSLNLGVATSIAMYYFKN